MNTERARNLVDTLRSLNLSIDLPQIAVMGDTSSGKSSVLSALSGVEFPANAELTTRSPVQLILSDAEEFSGTVYLHRYSGNRPNTAKVEIDSIEEVTKEITRLTNLLIEEGQSISDDSIIVKLNAPDLPNLTLTDLPGLIRTVAEDEDQSMIGKVEELVKRYLDQKRTIILAIIPANVDVHNSQILQAARTVDPTGNRTLGIITKPDLVDEGSEDGVLALIRNKKFFLSRGYHAVRSRGQKDLNQMMTIKEGIHKEAEFFKSNPSWRGVNKNLVGIEKLKVKLSGLLETIIVDALPTVTKEIAEQLKLFNQELTECGPPLDSTSSKRLSHQSSIEAYTNVLSNSIGGIYGEKKQKIRAELRSKDELFCLEILKTDIVCASVKIEALKVGDVLEVLHNGEWKLDVISFIDKDYVETKNHFKNPNGTNTDWKAIETMDLEFLKLEIIKNRGDELSIFPPYGVFKSIVKTYVEKWQDHVENLINEYHSILSEKSTELLSSLDICNRVSADFAVKTDTVLDSLKESAIHAIQEILECDFNRPFTQNSALYSFLKDLRNDDLIKNLKHLCGVSENGMVQIDILLQAAKNQGVGNLSNEDQEAKEMYMAIKAYLEVSKKRFIDLIPLLLDTKLVKPFIAKLKEQLKNSSDEHLENLLREPAHITHKRANAVEQIERLEKSQALIYNA